jgi:hypothetical protein
MMILILYSLTAIVLVSFTLSELNVTIRPASTLIRRAFFSPARTSFWYYDYFSKNEHTFLAASKIGFRLVQDPYAHYDMSYANMIGMKYLDNSKRHVNTGYMGNAYMNFGFLGMLIFSFTLGLVLLLADSICKTNNIFSTTAALGMPILSMVNGGLLTALLSKGFLLGIIIIWFHNERVEKL